MHMLTPEDGSTIYDTFDNGILLGNKKDLITTMLQYERAWETLRRSHTQNSNISNRQN